MSRFWAGASSSDSDSSSSDDSSDYSSDDDNDRKASGNRWVDMSDSSDSDDEVRVVKSAKERALELFQKHISAIRNAMKVRDYYEIQCQFDELSKAMIKNKKTLAEGVPRPLIRILVELEDFVPERLADKAAFKKLSARQGRALNRMKLTLKKHNKPFEMLMAEYRKNPVEDDDEDDEDDASSDSSSDSDSDDDSGSSSSSSSSSASGKKDVSLACLCSILLSASRGCPFIRYRKIRIEFLVSDCVASVEFDICRCQSGKNLVGIVHETIFLYPMFEWCFCLFSIHLLCSGFHHLIFFLIIYLLCILRTRILIQTATMTVGMTIPMSIGILTRLLRPVLTMMKVSESSRAVPAGSKRLPLSPRRKRRSKTTSPRKMLLPRRFLL